MNEQFFSLVDAQHSEGNNQITDLIHIGMEVTDPEALTLSIHINSTQPSRNALCKVSLKKELVLRIMGGLTEYLTASILGVSPSKFSNKFNPTESV